MKTISNSIIVAAVAASTLSLSASGAVIASWSMTTAVAATTGVSYTYGVADSGDMTAGSSLSSSHAAAATAYSSPSGNGSTYSLSSNNWAIGDYYQVSVSTTGYQDVSISWDQTRSSTGPASFELVASTDGGASWSTLIANYSIVQAGLAGTGTTSWNALTNQPGFFTTTSAAVGASDRTSVLFRIRSLVTTSAAGTNRIDNVIVSGSMVPAPGAVALLGLAGLISRRRR